MAESGSAASQARAPLKSQLSRAASSDVNNNQEIFMLPRQKSRSRERRESRLFLVDGQLCWSDDATGSGYQAGKRHSSVGMMFGSSMDLSGIGQSIDSSGGGGSGSEEAISYRIKWCRENIIKLKQQTWPMEKKLQVLKASKLFIKQHQGELKQSKQAKDVLASTSAIFDRYWRHFKREFANFLVIITPWEMRIKKIESHFGSVVASYFTFLRWIFWLNLANSLVMVAFVMVPELIENVPDLTGMRKGELGMQQPLGPDGKSLPGPEFNPKLGEMWEFEGFLKFSPIFYGYYSNVEISKSGFWRNPLAFLMSATLTYLFCFFCISRKLSQNTKLSRIGSKDDEYTFCWTVFVGWDFMIGNSETAYNKTSSLVMNLKEGILEEKEQTKDRDWRLILRRVFANVLTLMLIIASAYVVTLAVQRSENLPEDASLLQKNELQLVMSGIQFMFPPLFDVIGIIEKYHPRKALSWQLGRILFLDFLNFYTLMFSLFGTVDQMGNQLNEVSGNITLLRKNATYYRNLFTTTTTTTLAPEITSMADLGQNITTTMSSLASGTTGLFNVSTILTSVLLASSTVLPSLSSSDANQSAMTSAISSSSIPATSIFLDVPRSSTTTTTTTVASTTTEASSSPISTVIMQTIGSVAEQQTTLLPQPPPATTKSPDEEDYPDINEAIKVIGAKSRKKRKILVADTDDRRGAKRNRKRKQSPTVSAADDNTEMINSEREREDSGSSDELFRRSTTRIPTTSKVTTVRPKVNNRLHGGAYIAPMRDPYLSSKTNRPQYIDELAEESGDKEDEEEPLEGRLQVSSLAQQTIAPRPTRPVKPGLARPLLGGAKSSNIQRMKQTTSTTTTATIVRLDDDAMEDVLESSSSRAPDSVVGSGSGETIFFEPTTPETGVSGANSRGPDYAILEPDSTTVSPADWAQPTGSPGAQAKSGLSPTEIVADTSGTSPGLSSPPDATVTTESMSSCTSYSTALDGSLATQASLDHSGLGNFTNLKRNMIGFNASEVSYTDCIEIPEFKHEELLALNSTFKDKLKTLCWETMFGQEMVKIVVMDLVMTVISAVSFEFMRACFVRYCNRFFFWDLERGFPGYQDFKIAENVLHLVNNQSTVWMGMFFAPGLPAINTVKLAVLMYVRSWAVLTCNIPHETVFKVSKSNNFYYWILLINLLICILPVAYAVTWIRPSWHCGPFGGECRMYIVVTKLVKSMLPPEANNVFRYLTSPGAVIPILISLILIIYYLASTVSSSKEANKELKAQLKKDKEQEAAVPEITNTTVVDASPPPVASVGPVAAQQTPPASGLAPSSNTLAAPTSAGSGLAPATAGLQLQAESRPQPAKSLLMPPSIG